MGQEGSTQRQMFIKDLKQDLADASGMYTSDFNILRVSAGSVVVDLNAPETAAQEIQRQSLDLNSRLRAGKVTRLTDTITLQHAHLPTRPLRVLAGESGRQAPQHLQQVQHLQHALQPLVRPETTREFARTREQMHQEGQLERAEHNENNGTSTSLVREYAGRTSWGQQPVKARLVQQMKAAVAKSGGRRSSIQRCAWI